jgi:hypothetical protein
MTLGYQKELVRNWFDRGQNQNENTFDRFIYTWIALNAALAARFASTRGDKAKVRELGREIAGRWERWLDLDAVLREAAISLQQQSPIYREPPGEDGQREEVEVVSDDAVSVMLGIYAIRNNLFHGAKQFDAMRDHELVQASTRVLERVFAKSDLYEMAKQPGRDLTDPIDASEADAPTLAVDDGEHAAGDAP